MPHVIESTISLEGSVLTFVCDAYDEPLFLGLPRQMLRFHRKLAPYKASFSASSSSMCACSYVDTEFQKYIHFFVTSFLSNVCLGPFNATILHWPALFPSLLPLCLHPHFPMHCIPQPWKWRQQVPLKSWCIPDYMFLEPRRQYFTYSLPW